MDTVRTGNWMEDYWEIIKDTDIRAIKIPGTHDSGAFSEKNTDAVRDQALDIASQLSAGVRFLDLRVTHYELGCGYSMFHGVWFGGFFGDDMFRNLPGDTSQDLFTAVDQIATFLNNHPKEFVIVKLGVDRFADPGKVLNIVRDALDQHLHEYGDFLTSRLTPATLYKDDRRAILLVDDSWAGQDTRYFPCSATFQSSWNGDQQDPGKTKEQLAVVAKDYIYLYLATRYSDLGRFGHADAYIYGFDNREREEWLHTQIPLWINEWTHTQIPQWTDGCQLSQRLNIISIDFAGIDDIVRIIRLNTRTPAASGFTNALQFDYDGDGKKELLVYTPGTGQVCILKADENGAFNENGAFTQVYASANGIGGYDLLDPADRILALDFNGDGKADLLLYRPGKGVAYVLQSNGDGSFTTKFTSHNGIGGYDLLDPADKILTFDFNGDGKDDLLLYRPGKGVVYVLQSNGDGSFTQKFKSVNGIGGYDLLDPVDTILTFDFNGDKKADLLLYRPGKGVVYVLQSNGDGTFTTIVKSVNGIGGYDLLDPVDKILAFDFDGDKKDDLLLYRPGKGAVYVLQSNGNGTFTNKLASHNGIGGYDLLDPADRILALDFNGYGKADLLLYRPGVGAAYVLQSNGDGTFTQKSMSQNGIGGFDLKSTSDRILAFDYNGDGKDDLLIYRSGTGPAYVLRSNGDGTFTNDVLTPWPRGN